MLSVRLPMQSHWGVQRAMRGREQARCLATPILCANLLSDAAHACMVP